MGNQVCLVVTVGSELRADDGLGPYLAQLLEAQPLAGIDCIDGGMVPENTTLWVRKIRPYRLILIDAAQMGLQAGEIRRIDESQVARQLYMSTHTMPLNFLIANYKEIVPQVDFIGVQPLDLEFYGEMSAPVKEAAHKLYDWLARGADLDEFAIID